MSLAEGMRLSSYEITGLLGAGAMGKVYRARDERLGREVALKVLPSEFADNPDRRRRFEQEARAAGALNHPNIVAVYDAGRQDGVSYIAYELVDGELLRDLIRRGPVSARKAVDLAAQIADGLAAAHAAAITHRDLKPENIMITPDGRPKILDFGLARYEPKASESDGTLTMTQPGMLLGTPGYMSPEQVAGQPADARADLFALGAILHEMLTGKMVFERPTSIETMNAILREDPPELPAAVSPALRQIVEHALEKEPPRRYQSAQDLAFALRALSGSAVSMAPSSIPARKRRPAWPAIASVVAALVAVYAVAGLLLRAPGVDLAAYRFMPFATGSEPQGFPAWSPDGRSIAFMRSPAGQPDELMIRTLGSDTPVLVARGNFNAAPLWSPDGAHLLLLRDDGVYSVSRAGGAAEPILKGKYAAAAWSPDGKSLALWMITDSDFARSSAKLWISSPPGAAPRPYQPVLWNETGIITPVYLQFSPDGRQLAVMRSSDTGPQLWLLPFPGGPAAQPRRIFQAALTGQTPSIGWMPDNRSLLVASSAPNPRLWIGNTENGSVMALTTGESPLRSAAVSPDGRTIAYDTANSDSDLVEIPLQGGQMLHPLLATSRDESAPAWSPAGSQFAFVTNRTGSPEIWIKSTQEGWERPVVAARDFPGEETLSFSALAFSPDGQRLAYVRTTTQSLATIWISPAAGGTPVRLPAGEGVQLGPTWSPDGNTIAFMSVTMGGLAKIALGSTNPPVPLGKHVCEEPARWSPDGQWIVCPNRGELTLVSPDGARSRSLGNHGFWAAAWSKDSKELYAIERSATRSQLVSVTAATGSEKTLLDLGTVTPSAAGNGAALSLSPDGKSVTTAIATVRSDVWLLTGFPQPHGWLRRLWWPTP